MKYDLSILIPARNEQFLKRTVEDILEHKRGNTEIIVVLDGQFADPPLEQNEHVTVIYHSQPVGQRAATNEAAKLARGKYVMKVDAHCSFAKGFDVEMIAGMQDDWTMVPLMKNLHAFDLVCVKCAYRKYQGPTKKKETVNGKEVEVLTKCDKCGSTEWKQDVVWKAKGSPKSTSYCFDPTPHFQYFEDFEKRPEGKGDITPTMSLQGSCFMCTKERYFALNLCDEELGSWGSQGIEVACKTWLSGGQVMCNRKTWYAHMFRTQGGNFGFPYPQQWRKVEEAKKKAKDMFFNNKWPHQKYPLYWLVEKFWPITCKVSWTQADLDALKKVDSMPKQKKPSKGIVYYTHNVGPAELLTGVRQQILTGMKEKHIVSVSTLPISFGKNLIRKKAEEESGWMDMFQKILMGLEASTADVIFFCEHDVYYHPKHFDFVPPRKDAFYYNINVWKIRLEDGFALKVDDCKQLSGLVAHRELLLNHYKERIKRIKEQGFTRGNGFEPGTRSLKNGGYDDVPAFSYSAEYPNLDIRHGTNATQNRWRKDQFRNQKYTVGWTESHVSKIRGWESFSDILDIHP